MKLKAEFPVKCRDSAVLSELETGGVTFDASNCTSNVFVSNGAGKKIGYSNANQILSFAQYQITSFDFFRYRTVVCVRREHACDAVYIR